MKHTILALFLSINLLLASNSFRSMSNEELIALIGYVKPEKIAEFTKELESRKSSFSQKERAKYEKNLKKVKK